MKSPPIQISVVVPAYNCESTIKACIGQLSAQLKEFTNVEIIVVDNGKNPNLSELLGDFNVKILKRRELQSAAYARNEGCNNTLSGIIVFIDSDVIVEEQCIQNLIAPIVKNDCDATIGNYSTEVGSLTFAQKYKQLYIHNVYRRRPTVVKNDFWTAISAIKAEAFHELGGFDTTYEGASGEDQELGIRLTKNGYTVCHVKNALGLHKHNYTIKKIIINDIKKGLTVLSNTFQNDVPLTDHGHASKQDIFAVFFACFSLSCLIVSPLTNPLPLVATGLFSFFLWLFCKLDLLKILERSQGFGFTVQAIPLVFILDLVRAYCVVASIFKRFFLSFQGNRKSPERIFHQSNISAK